jgi:hypothetical protein
MRWLEASGLVDLDEEGESGRSLREVIEKAAEESQEPRLEAA